MQLVSLILKETINEKIVFSCNLCEDNMRNQIVQSQKVISVFDQHIDLPLNLLPNKQCAK